MVITESTFSSAFHHGCDVFPCDTQHDPEVFWTSQVTGCDVWNQYQNLVFSLKQLWKAEPKPKYREHIKNMVLPLEMLLRRGR